MNTENHTPTEPEKMQIRLSSKLHMPIILCPKDEPPHKGELKHMSIYELREFFKHVRSFFDFHVQDAENGAPVRILSCYYEAPNPEKETYYLPVRMQHGERPPTWRQIPPWHNMCCTQTPSSNTRTAKNGYRCPPLQKNPPSPSAQGNSSCKKALPARKNSTNRCGDSPAYHSRTHACSPSSATAPCTSS